MKLFLLCLVLRIQSLFSRKLFAGRVQRIRLDSPDDLPSPILDLGGGGEGVLGRRYGHLVTAIDLRQEELDEAPDGPVKVRGDARNLPFEAGSFSSVTAFYFFMYTDPQDHPRLFQEAFRVLKPGGTLTIWDAVIPPRGTRGQTLFVVPVWVKLPARSVTTAYGVSWKDRFQNARSLESSAVGAGFDVVESTEKKGALKLLLGKPISTPMR